MKKIFSLSMATIIALSTNTFAQDKVKDKTIKLETISVTSDSLGYSDVDSTKVSLKQANLLSDILRDIPGIYVGGTNGLTQQINMRGVTNRGINVTIDGAKQVGNNFHHNSNMLIDPELIKKVEASVGVNSVTQGINSLGGSMAFETVDASDLLEYDRNFGFKIQSGYASNNDEWGKSLTLYGKVSDYLEILGYVKHSSHDFGETGDGENIGGDGDDLSILLKGTAKISDEQKLSFSYNKMKYDGDYALRSNIPELGFNPLTYQEFIRDTYTLDYRLKQNDYIDLKLNPYYTKTTFESASPRINDTDVISKGVTLQNSSKISFGNIGNKFNYGIEYANSKSEDTKTSLNETTNSYAIYLEDQINYGRFTLTPGIRYNHSELEANYGTSSTNTSKDTKDYHDFTSSITAKYDFDNGLGLFAGYTELFRAPDVVESLRLSSSYYTDPNLEAETGDNKEIGINYKLDLNDSISMNFMAKYYKTKYDTIIEYDTTTRERKNSGGLTIDGYEALANFYIDDLKLGFGYSSSDIDKTEKLGAYGHIVGKDVGDKYTFNAEYFISSLNLTTGWNTLFMDKYKPKNENSDGEKPSYTVSDLYVQWQPGSSKFDGLTMSFGVYNIFDKNYASQTSFSEVYPDNEPGRSVKASLSYKF